MARAGPRHLERPLRPVGEAHQRRGGIVHGDGRPRDRPAVGQRFGLGDDLLDLADDPSNQLDQVRNSYTCPTAPSLTIRFVDASGGSLR